MNATTSEISVLFPEWDVPTKAVVVPGDALNDTFRSKGDPRLVRDTATPAAT